MKYFIEVWGCQMNEHDSEILAGIIEKEGYEKSATAEEADLIVLYTCCIREKAEKKVLGRIGALKKLQRNREDVIMAVGGCMTQQEDVAKMLQKRFKVDIIFGTHNINNFGELLKQAREVREDKVYEVLETDLMEIGENVPMKRDSDIKAYVNIIYGCNNFCAYCIVPYVRGREKSREVASIVEEVQGLLEDGYQEITLLGQNVNSYGKDLEGDVNFGKLLQELDVLGEYRLRFMSSHPRDFNKELVDIIKESKNVCPQFHLPFQAGSDRIIKEMNRGYTKEHYLGLTDYIKESFEEPALSTDIIVGFPSETEDDFLDTLDLVERVGFDQAYMFLYSIREGTRAATMADQVPEEVKKERFDRLLALQKKISNEKNKQSIGKVYEVLVEGKTDKGGLTGRTPGNKVVIFDGDEELKGQLVNVRITNANTWSLFGEME